ncbi:hypothetical protein LINPERPRIM_LOCUS21925 [Linum perenne]
MFMAVGRGMFCGALVHLQSLQNRPHLSPILHHCGVWILVIQGRNLPIHGLYSAK